MTGSVPRDRQRKPRLTVWILFLALPLFAVCERERSDSQVRPGAPSATPAGSPATSPEDRRALADGQSAYRAYNCEGCHGAGGGGAIGPALNDAEWIYGSDPSMVYASVVAGRPNGMPAFGATIDAAQVWPLVGFVRSLSGLPPAPPPSGVQDPSTR